VKDWDKAAKDNYNDKDEKEARYAPDFSREVVMNLDLEALRVWGPCPSPSSSSLTSPPSLNTRLNRPGHALSLDSFLPPLGAGPSVETPDTSEAPPACMGDLHYLGLRDALEVGVAAMISRKVKDIELTEARIRRHVRALGWFAFGEDGDDAACLWELVLNVVSAFSAFLTLLQPQPSASNSGTAPTWGSVAAQIASISRRFSACVGHILGVSSSSSSCCSDVIAGQAIPYLSCFVQTALVWVAIGFQALVGAFPGKKDLKKRRTAAEKANASSEFDSGVDAVKTALRQGLKQAMHGLEKLSKFLATDQGDDAKKSTDGKQVQSENTLQVVVKELAGEEHAELRRRVEKMQRDSINGSAKEMLQCVDEAYKILGAIEA